MSEPSLLFPDLPALVAGGRDGALTVANLHSGWSCTVTGVVAAAVRAALDGDDGPLAGLLGGAHELTAAARQLSGQRRLALTPTNALRLCGFDTLFLELNGSCNARCIHCYAGASPETSTALDRDTCSAILEDAAELGFRRIQLTGGEPLLCPFVAELVEQVAALRIPCCEIFTNGTLLTDELLARLGAERVRYAISFYSHDPAVHDAITRTPGSQQRTADAIARALRGGCGVRVSLIVMPENAAGIGETIAFLRALGVSHVSVTPSHAVGRGDYYAGSWGAAADARGRDGVQCEAPSDGERAAPRGKLCVTHDGRVIPCIFNREDQLGRVPARRLREIVASPWLPAAGEAPRTTAAFRQQLQCAGCRLTALALRECARRCAGDGLH